MCSAVCFFFFKQKTAYEMRISDWSSDVCSSDLPGVRVVTVGTVAGAYPYYPLAVLTNRRNRIIPQAATIAAILLEHLERVAVITEIGRASCRERVCQYV